MMISFAFIVLPEVDRSVAIGSETHLYVLRGQTSPDRASAATAQFINPKRLHLQKVRLVPETPGLECTIHNAGNSARGSGTPLKQSFKSFPISHICEKHIILVTWISQIKSVEVSAILANYCSSSCESLATGIEVISLTWKCLITLLIAVPYRLLHRYSLVS